MSIVNEKLGWSGDGGLVEGGGLGGDGGPIEAIFEGVPWELSVGEGCGVEEGVAEASGVVGWVEE